MISIKVGVEQTGFNYKHGREAWFGGFIAYPTVEYSTTCQTLAHERICNANVPSENIDDCPVLDPWT